MAGIDFFPKLDRSLDLKESNSKTSAAAPAKSGQAAKKPASSLNPKDETSFSDVLERDVNENEPLIADKSARSVKKDKPLRVESAQIKSIENRTEENRSDKAAMKQKAVVEFMDKMQSEFGVSPEDVLEAFSKLDEDALNGRPEDAMAQFLAALQLPKDQMPDAGKLYMKMVNETGDAMLSEKMAGEKAVVAFEVLSPKEMKLRKTTESLNQMSNQFFAGSSSKLGLDPLKSEPLSQNISQNMSQSSRDYLASILGEQPGAQTLDANGSAQAVDPKTNGIQGSSDGKISLLGLGLAAGGAASFAAKAAAQSKNAGEVSGSTASSLATDAAATAGAPTEASVLAALQSALGDDGSSGFDAQSGNGESAQNFENALSQLQAAATPIAPGAFAAAAAKSYQASTADNSTSDKDVTKLTDGSDLATVGLGHTPQVSDAKLPLAAGGMVVAQPTMTPEQRQDNINEIIKQAQFIVKEGGGEMKMELRPEGIGQVHLKVMVQDGKVDVQMLTENDSAKKLLESGLSELKSQLAASKLHVENMKVESGADAAFKKFEQGANDQQREQQRQFASDFMGQFRDERQSFFGNFMERGNASRGYRSDTRKRGSVDPVQVDGVVSANSTSNGREANSNRRLNLVA